MTFHWIGFIILLVTIKSTEILVDVLLTRFWTWLLSDENLNKLLVSLKPQLLIIYLKFLLKNNPVNKLPNEDEEKNSESNPPE